MKITIKYPGIVGKASIRIIRIIILAMRLSKIRSPRQITESTW